MQSPVEELNRWSPLGEMPQMQTQQLPVKKRVAELRNHLKTTGALDKRGPVAMSHRTSGQQSTLEPGEEREQSNSTPVRKEAAYADRGRACNPPLRGIYRSKNRACR